MSPRPVAVAVGRALTLYRAPVLSSQPPHLTPRIDSLARPRGLGVAHGLSQVRDPTAGGFQSRPEPPRPRSPPSSWRGRRCRFPRGRRRGRGRRGGAEGAGEAVRVSCRFGDSVSFSRCLKGAVGLDLVSPPPSTVGVGLGWERNRPYGWTRSSVWRLWVAGGCASVSRGTFERHLLLPKAQRYLPRASRYKTRGSLTRPISVSWTQLCLQIRPQVMSCRAE